MITLAEQHLYNVEKGPQYEGADALPGTECLAHPVRLIAYYLPQFHPVPVNDKAWGIGFTEWTNVTKAMPRYVGHYQPRLPGELGFYDLRTPDTIERQAKLARRAGIFGFCLHNYWFGGERVLETPLALILANPDINLRFCLNWANESWSRRWDGSENQLLLKQSFSADDDRAYAESMLPAVADPRYIRVDGRPIVMLYRPAILPDARATVERWREVFVRAGVGDPYVVMSEAHEGGDPRPAGFDAAAGFPPHQSSAGGGSSRVRRLDPLFRGAARSYPDLVDEAISQMAKSYTYHPGVCPGWDNEARKTRRGTSFYGATPAVYGSWLRAAANYTVAEPSAERRIVFINAWNEWAEGAYLEPDRHFGYAYLAETRRALDEMAVGSAREVNDIATPMRFTARETTTNMLMSRGSSALYRVSTALRKRRA